MEILSRATGIADLLVTNGFCSTTTENFLYKNDGAGQFARDTNSISKLSTSCSFGAAWGDFNNDGCLDLAVANCRGNASQTSSSNVVFRNLGNENNWVKMTLEGSVSNRSAIGARLRLLARINGQPVWQTRDISAQTGYNGQNSLQVHFGLADALQVDSLVIYWPSGIINYLGPLSIKTTHHFRETMVDGIRGALDEQERESPTWIKERVASIAVSSDND